MNWKYCDRYGSIVDSKGNNIKDSIGFQIDKVGNILQQSGAVKTKACQNCGNEFLVKRNQDELRQAFDKYVCTDCDFESVNPNDTLKHTLLKTDHKINLEEDSKVIGYKTTLTDTAMIKIEKNDCIILCKICNDLD